MKIEVGKFYRDADGNVGGPAFVWDSTVFHPYEIPGLIVGDCKSGDNRLFREDGSSDYGPSLVCEVPDPSAKPEPPASAGGGFFAGERIKLVSCPVRGARDIGEVVIAAPSACHAGLVGECVTYVDRHGNTTWSPAVFWERADDVKVLEGGYYLSKGGVVVGPMKKDGDAFRCSDKSIQHTVGFSQYWEKDGSVVSMTRGEKDHVLIMRLDVPAKPVEVVELKLSVDTSEMQAALQQVRDEMDRARIEAEATSRLQGDVIAHQAEQIGQLQNTLDALKASNGELHQLIEAANINCGAYRDSFVIASSDYFTTKAKLETVEAQFDETKRNLAHLAVIAQDQSDAINRLCDKNDWLQAKLFQTKAWCERFRKASVINAEAASHWRVKASRPVIRAIPAKTSDDVSPLVWVKLSLMAVVVFAAGVGCTLAVI